MKKYFDNLIYILKESSLSIVRCVAIKVAIEDLNLELNNFFLRKVNIILQK